MRDLLRFVVVRELGLVLLIATGAPLADDAGSDRGVVTILTTDVLATSVASSFATDTLPDCLDGCDSNPALFQPCSTGC